MSTRKDWPYSVPAKPNEEAAKDKSLCERCELLDLTVDRFIIGNAKTARSAAAIAQERQRYESKRADIKFRIKSGRGLKDFASLGELRDTSSHCPFCELIYSAMQRYSPGKTNEATSCSLTWEVDGRQVGPDQDLVNSTRRIRVSWIEMQGKTQEVYLVFVAPPDPLRPNSDATSRWERETHFLGREVGEQRERQALIKSWLDLCVDEHEEACRNTHSTERDFQALVEETYFGVIDVVDMQLKALPMKDNVPEPFVALSYVWGKQAPDHDYRTTRTNVMTYIRHGGLQTTWDWLPQTIQDAILLVSRLGYRYIWIDAICIVQDSNSSWQLNAQAMHLVYGNAVFTICAADGVDSSAGLPAARPRGQAQSQQPTGTQHPATDDTTTIGAKCAPGVRLMVTRPLEAVVHDSEWSTRAWTFQERVLSRRCLIFAEGRVYFQCRTTGISQDIYTDGQSGGWSLDRVNSPLQTLRELQRRPLWFYMKYISMYTGRKLTKPGDILAAFEGISWLLGRYMGAPSLFGLPASHFDLALLWSPTEALKLRNARRVYADEKANLISGTIPNAPGDWQFPTWSWSGWMDGRIEYELDMIEGCLLNVSEWLKRHTWIQWYIRNEKGHLRPLWEVIARGVGEHVPGVRIDPEDDGRWQGYKVPEPRRHRADRNRQERERQLDDRLERARRELEDLRLKQLVEREAEKRPPMHQRFYSDGSTSRDESPGTYSPPPPRRPRPPPREMHHRPQAQQGHRPRVVRIQEPYNDDEDDAESRALPQPIIINNHIVDAADTASDSAASTEQASTWLRVGNEQYTRRTRSRSRSNYVMDRSASRTPSGGPAYKDKYGRIIRSDFPRADDRMFHSILPDNPFGVIRDNTAGPKEADKKYMPVLQFWTWLTELHVSIREQLTSPAEIKVSDGDSEPKETQALERTRSDNGLCKCDVVDAEGDWCGFIVLETAWIQPQDGHLFHFIAISEAKAFTQDECPDWTYYIPKERNECEWDLYYVLLLERNQDRGVWERVGLGKVFKAAFRENTWSEIKLG